MIALLPKAKEYNNQFLSDIEHTKHIISVSALSDLKRTFQTEMNLHWRYWAITTVLMMQLLQRWQI